MQTVIEIALAVAAIAAYLVWMKSQVEEDENIDALTGILFSETQPA